MGSNRSTEKLKALSYPFNRSNSETFSKRKSNQFRLFTNKVENFKNSVRALRLYRSIYGNEINLAGDEKKNLRDAIRLAIGANEYAKSIFSHRGNVLEDVVESQGLAYLQRKFQHLLEKKINKSINQSFLQNKKRRSSIRRYYVEISAYLTQGSTCGHFASAAFTFAGELNKNEELIVYFCVHSQDHAFLIISDKNKDIFIACDPWANFFGNVKTNADYIKKFHHADQAAVPYNFYYDAVNALLSHSSEQKFFNDVIKIIPFEEIDFNYDEAEKSIETFMQDESLLKSFYKKESKKASKIFNSNVKIETPDQLHDTVKRYPFWDFPFYDRSSVESEFSEEVKFGDKVKIPYRGDSESEEEQDLIRGRGIVLRIK